MGVSDFFRHKAPNASRPYPVEKAPDLLVDLLRRNGFSMEAPGPALAWALFKEFCQQYRFCCDDDALLWEIGPYVWLEEGGRAFQWHLVRQFTNDPGDDDNMKQLCFDLDFAPCLSGGHPAASLWSYDFDGDFTAFFAAVEARPDFVLPADAHAIRARVMWMVCKQKAWWSRSIGRAEAVPRRKDGGPKDESL